MTKTLKVFSTIAVSAAGVFASAQIAKPRPVTKIESVRMDETTISLVLHQFKKDCHRYPTTAEGLKALVFAPPALVKLWRGPYVTRRHLPKDPWGRAYVYRFRNGNYSLTSFGRDGHRGGAGEDADFEMRG